jgi:hypothetical protein
MDYDIDDSDVVMLDDPIDKIEFEPDVNILNLFTNRKSLPKDLFTISLTNLNKHNWFPLVDFKRKMTESETKIKSKIDGDAVIQSETDYLVERFDIFKNSQFDYSLVSDALQYSVLCPFVSRHGDAYRLPDRDCFRWSEDDNKLERYRLIGKLPPHLYDGDKVVNKGFYICNRPTMQDKYIEFDAQAYMTHLHDAKPRDEFVLVTNDGKRLLTSIELNIAGSHLILKDVAKKKKTIRYDLANFEKNRFMLYPKSSNQKMFPKKVFLTENVLVKSIDASPCIITGDDVMGMMSMTYQKLRDMFPDIDNQVFDIRSWKHLSSPSGSTSQEIAAAAATEGSKMMAQMFGQKDDIDLLVRCGKKPRQMMTYEPPPQQPPPFAFKSNLVFLSVQESLNHVITKFNPKSIAYLILVKYFKLKEEKNKIKDFPLSYEVFVLKHLRLPNGRIIWFKEENITSLMPIPVVQYEPPVVVQDVDKYISNALDLYYQRKSSDMHVVLPIDYSNYQGQNDFDESLFITEFGWLGNDINNDEDADVEQQMDNDYLNKFLNTCVSFARIRLPLGQLNEIRKCLLKEKTNEDLLSNTLVIFGLFIIFAQCNLPRLIIADTTIEQVNSFPIGTSFTLVDHFASVILKLTKQDYNCRRLKKANSNAWRELLVRVCKALLLSKPALRVHLEAAGNQMNVAIKPGAKKRVENDTSLWKPIVSKPKHVNHLMQMELEMTPITIGEKITTQVKFKPQGKNHSTLRSVQKVPSALEHQHPFIEQEHVTLIAPVNEIVSLPDLQTILGTLLNNNSALKKDLLFSNLYHVTKNETVWNEISTCIANIQTTCPALVIMNDLSDSVLLDCLTNDFKDFLGKYTYNYLGAQNFIHMDQIKRLHMDRDHVKWILDNLLNFASFVIYPQDDDLHYALVYIVYKVMWAIESVDVESAMEFGPTLCNTNEYLIKLLQQKQTIYSINVKTARDKYEIIRENRKKMIMKMYGEKDAEGRQGLQKVVRMGLVNIEDVVSDYLANIADDADVGANEG